MENIMILNASPRAPVSNSRQYAGLFAKLCPANTQYFAVTKSNHPELCRAVNQSSGVLLVFPLYADGIPVTLLNFLKSLESMQGPNRPAVSLIINCGFIEPEQNDVAVRMVRLFCEKNGYPFGSVLKIGSGEAILSTPFRLLVRRKIKRLAQAAAGGRSCVMQVTMPLSKRAFIRASTKYWVRYGQKNGIDKEQMQTMSIEQ